MNGISYRDAKVDDAGNIVNFYNRAGGETFFLSFEKDEYPMDQKAQAAEIQSLEGNPNNKMLLAMAGEEIAGIATIHSTSKVKGRHDGELGIVVAAAYQGKGIGTELIRQLLDWARGNGVTTRISLDTMAINENAIRLYRKFGFEVEGCRRNAILLNGKYYDLCAMGMML